ncbi:MAG: hypothetical protein QOH49_4191 [Acidobacteriota bacterium]|jgi:hypothetical protein|nr:hypothetical protein [Acidobacteriota bacterium]
MIVARSVCVLPLSNLNFIYTFNSVSTGAAPLSQGTPGDFRRRPSSR